MPIITPQTKKQEEESYDSEFKERQMLVESKMARKRAEEDAKLLLNRIALLKAEEERSQKKINETKQKSNSIYTAKERHVIQSKKKESVPLLPGTLLTAKLN